MKYERSLLFGRWFREEIEGSNKKVVEYAYFSADGSCEFTFVTLNLAVGKSESMVEQITELGDWGLVGDIHFTITKEEIIDEKLYSADLNNSDNYHAYKVLTLNHQVFKYQHIDTNETYVLRKITDNIGHC